ncbi:MAG: Asp-tRNA(Asn)/Glu-tRNA(Gln) amidotransferase subunit GatB [Bacteroidetes bacterium]|nr:Asp-tRNA(Asn)/Glu-tRNA(Gln) amidotransferase subunit GatB [Bacteroidota bacterium]
MGYYSDKYEAVIGLEVHAQLLTKTKLFCADPVFFGAAPNTQISPISLAYPGTLPKLNEAAIELAVRLGLACGCEIEERNYFARKHYFYPDLPKGYQISQHTTPICKGGTVSISTSAGERDVQLNRIHLEEDAGKSIHDLYDDYSAIDYNRAGVPLVEIVTEPDMHNGEEAAAYLTELRELVRQLGVCDGNMEEGSLRCDANISIRPIGSKELGTKAEVKNLNSIRFLKKAIDYEVQRMIDLVESGETVKQETRSFDAATETTFSIRTKEDANDYRYFNDPDLPAFVVMEDFKQRVKAALPELPKERKTRLIQQYQLNVKDATRLASEKPWMDYFEAGVKAGASPQQMANWMLGLIRSYLNEQEAGIENLSLTPLLLSQLIALIEDGSVSHTVAVQQLFPLLVKDGGEPRALAVSLNLIQERNTDTLSQLVEEVLDRMPEKVQEYKKGKKGLIGLFVGEVMKLSKGKADPKMLNQLIADKLKS